MSKGNKLEERKSISTEIALLTEDRRRFYLQISQNTTPERRRELQDVIGSIETSLEQLSARLDQLDINRD